MPHVSRRSFAVAVVLLAGVVIAFALVRRSLTAPPRAQASPSEGAPAPIPALPTQDPGPGPTKAEALAWSEPVVSAARAALEADGLTGPQLDAFCDTLKSVFVAQATADFDAYDALMQTRGSVLNEHRAALLAQNLHDYGSSGLTNDQWAALSERERVRHVWRYPDRRFALWKRVREGSVIAGVGLVPAPFDDGASPQKKPGMYTYSAWDNQGGFAVFNAIQRREIPAAWVEMTVEFASGPGNLIWLFAYDEARKTWRPHAIRIRFRYEGNKQGYAMYL